MVKKPVDLTSDAALLESIFEGFVYEERTYTFFKDLNTGATYSRTNLKTYTLVKGKEEKEQD